MNKYASLYISNIFRVLSKNAADSDTPVNGQISLNGPGTQNNFNIYEPESKAPTHGYSKPYTYVPNTQHFVHEAQGENGVTTTPASILNSAYTTRDGDSIFTKSVEDARAYRAKNKDQTWLQGVGDSDLTKPVVVKTFAEDHRALPKGSDAFFSGFGYNSESGLIGLKGNSELLDNPNNNNRQVLMEHEGTHAMQHNPNTNTLKKQPGYSVYTKGLEPNVSGASNDTPQGSPSESHIALGDRSSYHLRNDEVEARLSGLQREFRVNQSNLQSQNKSFIDPQNPQNARTYLKSNLESATPSPHINGLHKIYQKLPENQRELFLNKWSKKMPGFVNTQQPNTQQTA